MGMLNLVVLLLAVNSLTLQPPDFNLTRMYIDARHIEVAASEQQIKSRLSGSSESSGSMLVNTIY